ncbi:hypothetical protein Cgig2_025621 [Carnegiea gigantea]|uniref:Uncharacterized protein n=1 Tax=Carnegiea gigantea TaxID=171969 RepID=A0A9Q1Q7R9_9CARY|nr:hypothetical protein Cgig2_025621 [Carnegiea gigantea]
MTTSTLGGNVVIIGLIKRSARSLAGSDTPPFRSYLRAGPRSGPSALGHDDHSSSDDEETTPIPIPGNGRKTASSQPRQIPRPTARGAMLAASVNLPIQGNALSDAFIGLTGRRMLSEHSFEHNAFGQWLGWLMAAIYMGGRIPQIVLNIIMQFVYYKYWRKNSREEDQYYYYEAAGKAIVS